MIFELKIHIQTDCVLWAVAAAMSPEAIDGVMLILEKVFLILGG